MTVMNDYLLFQLSLQKRHDAQRERTRDRLAELVHCCQPHRIRQSLTALLAARRSPACSTACA